MAGRRNEERSESEETRGEERRGEKKSGGRERKGEDRRRVEDEAPSADEGQRWELKGETDDAEVRSFSP